MRKVYLIVRTAYYGDTCNPQEGGPNISITAHPWQGTYGHTVDTSRFQVSHISFFSQGDTKVIVAVSVPIAEGQPHTLEIRGDPIWSSEEAQRSLLVATGKEVVRLDGTQNFEIHFKAST